MFTKFAKASIVGVKSSPTRLRTASLAKFSDYDDYRTDDGFMYVRVRAISSRVNKNHDGWPSDELAKSFRTFIGKPIFIDHHNHDPQKARGVVVDAALHVEDLDKTASLDPYYSTAPENHKPPTWVELLLETDAKTFPKLAKAVIAGDIDGVSMGCNVERSRCSVCSNWARSPEEYCKHIISKGAYYDHKQPNGTKISKRSYEDCYDIGFFEISYVFDPADETALIFDKKHAQHRRMVAAAVRKEADNPPPQSDMTNIPQEVDTLRQEQLCPVCGSMMDDGACETCNYQEPPQGFDNPDLEQAKEMSQPQPPPQPEQPAPDPSQQQGAPSPMQPAGQGSPMPMASSYNTTNSNGVTNKMEWRILEKTAAGENSGGRINTQERPILPVTRQTSDKPVNAQTVTNPAKPVEATNKGEQMKTADGTGATPAGEGVSADERVDVLGVGAVDDNAEQGTKHENVEKEVGITGPHTDTWHGDEGDSLGQHAPVTDDVDVKAGDNGIGGPIGSPVSSIQVMADGTWGDPGEGSGTQFPDHEPTRVDLLVPIAEPVGDHTMTWQGDDFHITDPITSEDGNDVGGPMGVALSKSEIKTHIFRAMRIAEVEVDLGMTPPTDKYERAAELEEEAPAALVAREETLSRVKTAGLGKTAKTAASASRMPSMRTAGVEHEAAVSGDEGLFL